MPLRDLPNDRKARSVSLDLPADPPLKEAEDLLGELGRDPCPSVADLEACAGRLPQPGPVGNDLDLGGDTVRSELEGVVDEVVEGFRDPDSLGAEAGEILGDENPRLGLVDLPLEAREDLPHGLPGFDILARRLRPPGAGQ